MLTDFEKLILINKFKIKFDWENKICSYLPICIKCKKYDSGLNQLDTTKYHNDEIEIIEHINCIKWNCCINTKNKITDW